MRTAVLMLMLLATGAGLGCDPSTSFSRLGVLAFARNGLLAECCNCLATQEVYVDYPLHVCPEVDVEMVGDGAVDGGCVDDGGLCVPAELRQRTPCLCSVSANECRNRLSQNRAVVVVGRCIEPEGPCERACGGVLAYPEP